MLSPPSSEEPLAFVTSLIMLSNSSEKQERSEQFALHRNLLQPHDEDASGRSLLQDSQTKYRTSFHFNMKDLLRCSPLDLYLRKLATLRLHSRKQSLQCSDVAHWNSVLLKTICTGRVYTI